MSTLYPVDPLEDIPRFDTANCSMAKNRDRGMEAGGGGIVGRNPSRERVIPILVEDTGQTITPAFSRLEDPQPFTPFKSQKSSRLVYNILSPQIITYNQKSILINIL